MSRLGRPRAHHRVVDSTNERAKALAAAGAPHGTVVTADEQTAGRGRQGRAWVAPPGAALLASVVVGGFGERQAVLPLAAAVAVCEAVEASAGVACTIKWPNDIWADGRKLAGILIEARSQEGLAVIGVGLNVTTRSEDFPEELRKSATSLAIESREDPPSREIVLEALLAALERRLEDTPTQTLERWRERDALRGKRVVWHAGEGTALGVGDGGELLVDTGDGVVRLDAGEVHLGRP